jgi:1,4-dihydroxy-2-naphthoate octaprenyltransferase
MHKTNWLLVGIVSFVLILILFGAGMLMSDWRYRDWGMMGPVGMMEDWTYSSPPAPLGWIGMIFVWLIPIGLMVLVGFIVAWFVRNVRNSKPPSS